MRRAVPRRPRWWIALVQVVLLLATIVTPVAAATDPSPMTGAQLIQLLREYQIVRGDDQGNLNLDKSITRAEMFTILTRAMGAEADAALFKGFGVFSDAKGHWAEGYINWAAANKLVRGDGNGTVRPQDPVSYAEALTLILRLADKEPTTGDWPTNVLIEAAELGLVPDGVNARNIREAAVRGQIFASLGKALVTVPAKNGKTLLQTYVDKEAPVLELATVASSTKDTKVTVSGSARGASGVTVNGNAVSLTADSKFSATVDLNVGTNEIKVEAVDKAGNVATKTLSISRIPPVASLQVAGPDKVVAGATAQYTVTALDKDNKAVSTEGLTAKVEGNIGTYDVQSGVFTAGTSTATGKIIFTLSSVSKSVDVSVLGASSKVTSMAFRQVNGGRAVAVTKPMTVEVTMRDASGALVTEDNGRQISLVATGNGVAVTPSIAKTVGGVATFTVTGTSPGSVMLTASALSLPTTTEVATFGTSIRVVLTATQSTMLVGSSTANRISAELRDDNGNLTTNNTGSDIIIRLQQNGATGILSDSILTIRRGYNSSTASGDDGLFSAAGQSGTTTLTGSLDTTHGYSVEPVNISINKPSVGYGAKIQAINLSFTTLRPGVDAATFTIRVTDNAGNVVRDGSYAFQVNVDTSTNEPKTNGLPRGVNVYLGSTSRIPVYTGTAPTGNYVYARTRDGYATLTVTYDRSGEVIISPVLVDAVSVAYDDTGATGGADGTRNFTIISDRAYYASAASALRLTVDSDLGNDQTAGSVPPSSARYFTLRAWVTDGSAWVPGASPVQVTLTRVSTQGATTAPQTPDDIRNTVDGKAEFRVFATSTQGCDTYKITGPAPGNWESNTVTLCTNQSVPAAPRVIVVRGANGTVAGQPNLVSSTDDRMEIELYSQANERSAAVVLYRHDSSTPLYTTQAIDMTQAAPRVSIPKSSLPTGQLYYRIALKNGAGEGEKSANIGPVTVAAVSSNAQLAYAKYDSGADTAATSGKLYVTAYGVYRNGGTIDTSKLILRDASSYNSGVRLTGASYTLNDGQFVIDLSTAPSIKSIVDNQSLFSGTDVTIDGEVGWYYNTSGETATAYTAKPVGPFATITAVVFDRQNNTVTLTGSGFNSGSYNLAKLRIQQGENAVVFDGNSIASVNRISDTQMIVTLNQTAANLLKDQTKFSGTDILVAEAGWMYDGSFRSGAISAVSVSGKVDVTRVTYVKTERAEDGSITTDAKLIINGSGFFSGLDSSKKGAVSLNLMKIHDLDFPENANRVLNATDAVINIKSDGEMEITLNDDDAKLFEDTYGGDNIFFYANFGWFTDYQGRKAIPVPERYFRLTID